jgi:glycosyltransferase involved in cell wall biosynthesis
MHKIILHYPFVPSYRVAVFNKLACNKNIDLKVFSAKQSGDNTLLSKNVGWHFNHLSTQLFSMRFFGRIIDMETGVFLNLIKFRHQYKYYIILSNPNIVSSWLYAGLAKLLGYKVVFWGHGLLRKETGFQRLLRRLYYNLADKHWVYGNRAISLMEDLGIQKKTVYPIYNSLDYPSQKKYRELNSPRRNEIRNKLGFSNADFVGVCMGRLLTKLKINEIILNVKNAHDVGVNLRLIIIGDGPEKQNLEQLAKEESVSDSVIFVGAIYDESILSEYYIAADLSIIMGVVGLAAMHSLGYGIPVLTNDDLGSHCPEIEAITAGETGELFTAKSNASFISSLLVLYGNKGSYFEQCIATIEQKYTPESQVLLMVDSLNE